MIQLSSLRLELGQQFAVVRRHRRVLLLEYLHVFFAAHHVGRVLRQLERHVNLLTVFFDQTSPDLLHDSGLLHHLVVLLFKLALQFENAVLVERDLGR